MLSQDAEMLNYTHAVPGYRVYEKAKTKENTRVSAAILYASFKTVALVLVVLMSVFYFLSGYMAQRSYEMQTLRTEIMQLEKENETARLEVARLESPARIQAIAENELGMHVPQKAIYGSSDVHINQARIHD